jgi:hypothetical protein
MIEQQAHNLVVVALDGPEKRREPITSHVRLRALSE